MNLTTEQVERLREEFEAWFFGRGITSYATKMSMWDAVLYFVSVRALTDEPVATLHDDGYWTWKKGAPPHESNYAGWRMDVYGRPSFATAMHK